MVTEDVNTFPAAINQVPVHSGVVFCDSERWPRTPSGRVRLGEALAEFATRPPSITEYPGFVWWL